MVWDKEIYMEDKRGKDILIKKVRDDGKFEKCEGMRKKRIELNEEKVDVKDEDDEGRWRKLMEGRGVKSE